MAPSAKIIADSISPAGYRLTTMEVVMHRFVLAEFNTHRVFSRNSASSRAIPVEKQIARVIADPAWPISWPAEQPGMQGGADLAPVDRLEAQELFELVQEDVLGRLRTYFDVTEQNYPDDPKAHRLHKSLLNRLLEPFMWHTVVVSSTEWDNFWHQRCTEFSPLAQPEMRAAADAMLAAYRRSEPTPVSVGAWHLPYTDAGDRQWATEADDQEPERLLRRLSVARCARVSYLTHDGVRDPSEDLALYDRLVSASPPHASPLEHVATPMGDPSGNFDGWCQLRHLVPLG